MNLRTYFQEADWIWLDAERWPEAQTGRCTTFGEEDNYAVGTFCTTFSAAGSIRFRVSADCKYILRVDGGICSRGPAIAGGDYGNREPLGYTFFDEFRLELGEGEHTVRAEVFLSPDVMAEYSEGRGGFLLEAAGPGGRVVCKTDGSWNAYLNPAYPARYHYLPAKDLPAEGKARLTGDARTLLPHALRPLVTEIIPAPGGRVVLDGAGPNKILLDFGKTYSCYLHAEISCELDEGEAAPDLFFACYEKEDCPLTSREEHVELSAGQYSFDRSVLATERYVWLILPAFRGRA